MTGWNILLLISCSWLFAELIPVNVNNYNSDQYNIIHCVGYLKCWNSSGSTDNSKEDGEDSSSLTCLIAIGRSLNNFSNAFQAEKPTFFMSKHTVDGKFLFVDHWWVKTDGYYATQWERLQIWRGKNRKIEFQFGDKNALRSLYMFLPFYRAAFSQS